MGCKFIFFSPYLCNVKKSLYLYLNNDIYSQSQGKKIFANLVLLQKLFDIEEKSSNISIDNWISAGENK